MTNGESRIIGEGQRKCDNRQLSQHGLGSGGHAISELFRRKKLWSDYSGKIFKAKLVRPLAKEPIKHFCKGGLAAIVTTDNNSRARFHGNLDIFEETKILDMHTFVSLIMSSPECNLLYR